MSTAVDSQAKEPRSYTITTFFVAAVVAATLEFVFIDVLPQESFQRFAMYAAFGLVAVTVGHFAGKAAAKRSVGIRYGERVRVRSDRLHGSDRCPGEPAGVIVSWRGRLVQTSRGPTRMLWVRFDVPQRDADGNGPHEAAEVLEDYLERAPD